MVSLRSITENQIRAFLNVSEDEFIKLQNPAPEDLHEPTAYAQMMKMVAYLKEEKVRQSRDPQKILGFFGDYDADGICASAIGSAALSVFGFRYFVAIPTMEEGYGLNRKAVDRMLALVKKQGYRLDMIVTADNGISAHDGVIYAAEQGITVLVTDHHPVRTATLPPAMVCVDPWRPDDTYPFKYNSGATVLWKVMLTYAMLHEPEKLPLIKRLIVLAGLSNVADVMPVVDENRYMVVRSLEILEELRKVQSYQKIADTEYEPYNTVFWGLYDLIHLLQESKDAKRLEAGKRPVPLPHNEELVSWYLAPMLNAPRRVHGTCLEAMSAFMIADHKTRQDIIRNLIELNEMKTQFRDKVLENIDPEMDEPVICVNTRHGISGLIAGRLAEGREMPSIVFAKRNDQDETVVYEEIPEEGTLTASARSNELCPLDRVIEEVNRRFPGMIRGGGHSTAAGITIDARDYQTLKKILPDICERIIKDRKANTSEAAENKVQIFCVGGNLYATYVRTVEGIPVEQTEFLDPKIFAWDVTDTYHFLESLRPFGNGFEADTNFELIFDQSILQMSWDPAFWKTFKFNLYGVECLTFHTDWANTVKKELKKDKCLIRASAKITLNTFRGETKPQLQLSPAK